MRLSGWQCCVALVTLLALFLSGCAEFAIESPLDTKDIVFYPQLTGDWSSKDENGRKEVWTLRAIQDTDMDLYKANKRLYDIDVVSSAPQVRKRYFSGAIGKIGNLTVFDIIPDAHRSGEERPGIGWVPVHIVTHIAFEGDDLKVDVLDDGYDDDDQLCSPQSKLPTAQFDFFFGKGYDESPLIIAKGPQFKAYIQECGSKGIFKSFRKLTRIPGKRGQ